MKKLYFLFLLSFVYTSLIAQQPYIGTAGGDGLGQYGYLEKDAVTFSRLFRNTYSNIAYLSARWWITDNNSGNGNGKEYIYNVYDFPISSGGDWNPAIGWQCGGDNDGSKRTTDYNSANFSPEWTAGSDCYVSVCAKFCDNSFYPASFNGTTTNGSTGFNERHFQVIDVDTTLHVSTSLNIPDGNGICSNNSSQHVAGSFTVNPGALTGRVLTRLYVKNNGSAQETTDIPNGGLNVFYEASTGSEVFGDGNDTFAGTLWGDWGGGSTTDNIFGNEALNIPLNGKVRIYVLLCDYNSPTAIGKSIDLAIVNDGISLSPELDSYSKMRINSGSISQRVITLPVRFLQFDGSRNAALVNLSWKTELSSQVSGFRIQHAADGIHFTDAGNLSVNDFYNVRGQYRYSINSTNTYFRIAMLDQLGARHYSNIIRIAANGNPQIRLLQNPVRNEVLLENQSGASMPCSYQITDATGKQLLTKNAVIQAGINSISIPASVSKQVLFLHIRYANGNPVNYKLMKE